MDRFQLGEDKNIVPMPGKYEENEKDQAESQFGKRRARREQSSNCPLVIVLQSRPRAS